MTVPEPHRPRIGLELDDPRTDLIIIGSWMLSKYFGLKELSIYHICPKRKEERLVAWWGTYACSLCNEQIPDELQALYVLYNMDE